MHTRMLADPVDQRLLRDKSRIRSEQVDIDLLRALPQNTYGYAYAQFLDSNGYALDTWLDVQRMDDLELAYVMQRYRETHDFNHVLYSVPTTVFGEFVIKYAEVVQTGLLLNTAITYVGWLKATPGE